MVPYINVTQARESLIYLDIEVETLVSSVGLGGDWLRLRCPIGCAGRPLVAEEVVR